MSGECDSCGEHCLDCHCDENIGIITDDHGWRSVKDHLPDESQSVLSCDQYGEIRLDCFFYWHNEEIMWNSQFTRDEIRITYWKPMCAPPMEYYEVDKH